MQFSFKMGVAVAATLCSWGCVILPPSVENSSDIERLRVNARSVRARGLSDEDIPFLARLKDLEYLDFTGGWGVMEARITDEGLHRLSQLDLPRLAILSLGYCDEITDAGLAHLAKMDSVRDLSLMVCTGITDAGLQRLAGMNHIEWLDLRGCPLISDEGLKHLHTMTNANDILLGGCENVSEEAVAVLQKALPDCRVSKDEREWSFHVTTSESNTRIEPDASRRSSASR